MSGDNVTEEKYEFEAEVPQVMSIIINSVYSSKELFLRELVSNASDALSKMMSQKQSFDDAGYATQPICSYKIQIIPDNVNKTLTIKDNGIGMTKADLINYLGSIASSGTKKFREALDKSKGNANVDALIGQFGLGFYASFLVAEKVDVITKNPKDEGYIWSSTGNNSYTISKFDVAEHGTSIILKLKEGEEEYLKAERLTDLIKKHSLYIKYPIALLTLKEEETKEKEGEIEGEVEEIKEEKEEVKEDSVMQEQIINSEIPVWTKKVEEIPEADLKKFYKSISNDYDDYAAVQSWHFEGMMDLKILLFIPKRAKMNFFEKQQDKNTNIKVFNSNVFVTDDLGKDVVPDWMNFVVGAVSSSDFPMNISREFLQGKAAINLLKTKLPKCVSEMIKKLEKDESAYSNFYKEFSSNIKLAVRHYTDSQQETFAKFLRYPTNKDTKLISLDEYLALLGENDKQILILTGLNKKEVETSLYLEGFSDRNVLLMHEAIDEIMLQGLKTYKNIPFQMISAEGVESSTASEENAEYTPFKDFIKEMLKDKVERVEISRRFVGVPATLLTTKYANSSAMENIIKSHPGSESNPMLMMMMQSKKIFEINIDNVIIKLIKGYFDENKMDKVNKYVNFLFNSSLVGCGFALEDKSAFIKDLYSIFTEAVSKDSTVETA